MTEASDNANYVHLSSYRKCVERIANAWPEFASQRAQRLRQGLFDAPVEKVAENILEDLFTKVLDWDLSDVNLQIGRADIVLSDHGFKRLVLEVKRPGTLQWHWEAVKSALKQPWSYAAAQKVGAVAISDGSRLYAADLGQGGPNPRLFVSLETSEAPLALWWISVHGIYRPCPTPVEQLPLAQLGESDDEGSAVAGGDELLDSRYHLPARCFAYVSDPDEPATWKLPYLLPDGRPDLKRLPKAIQAMLSNYRGVKVSIPREATGDVLVRLGRTAKDLGKMPCQRATTASAYVDAHAALDQLERLQDVSCC